MKTLASRTGVFFALFGRFIESPSPSFDGDASIWCLVSLRKEGAVMTLPEMAPTAVFAAGE
ncbi:hypothetical protein ACIA8C_19545 [Nocardia sp. NPDC051321]|uniref:hypothetical protein n=1 Tax=Nocardia sp. NPDC051321 TaxID=3364323 RepID=UPI003794D1E5